MKKKNNQEQRWFKCEDCCEMNKYSWTYCPNCGASGSGYWSNWKWTKEQQQLGREQHERKQPLINKIKCHVKITDEDLQEAFPGQNIKTSPMIKWGILTKIIKGFLDK